MNRNWIMLLAAMAASACNSPDSEEATARKAWAKCQFELDKIEAIRGRNLDDLDKGLSVARNQFMMDCLNVEFGSVTIDQVTEMSKYANDRKSRAPDDMSLNNGKR